MRSLLFASLALPILVLAGCSNNNAADNASANLESIDLPRFLVRPGAVTGDRSSGINGTFTLTQAKPGTASEGGIPGDQLGGACIIFRAQDLPAFSAIAQKVCHTGKDCETTAGPGYCSSDHKCWARPNADPDTLCRKSGDTDPPQHWQDGQQVAISDNPIAVPPQLQPNAQARVVALTRGKSPGLQQVVLTWGDPTAIP